MEHIHDKSVGEIDDASSIKILLQALNWKPQRKVRRKRVAKQHEEEDDHEEVIKEEGHEANTGEFNQKKQPKHSFKTRIHGDKKRKMLISQIPITDGETVVQETIDLNVDDDKDSGN